MATEKIQHKYKQLFASELGQEVLEDLQKLWRSPPSTLDLGSLSFLEGQRHVIRYIETLIEKGEKES